MIGRYLPPLIYLDTSIVVAAIVEGSENARASAAFCDRLADEGTRVFFSQIMRLELSQAIRRLATKPERLDPNVRDRFGLDDWEHNILVRQRWFDYGVRQFEARLETFAEVFELPFRKRTWRASIGTMVDSHLQSHDAIHVATAREYRIRSFATTDEDFTKIGDLDVWLVGDDL